MYVCGRAIIIRVHSYGDGCVGCLGGCVGRVEIVYFGNKLSMQFKADMTERCVIDISLLRVDYVTVCCQHYVQAMNPDD